MTATSKPAVLSQKSIDLLRIAGTPVWDLTAKGRAAFAKSERRIALMEVAAAQYSWKAVEVKMKELEARRYVDIVHDWADAQLTEKGRAALEAHTA